AGIIRYSAAGDAVKASARARVPLSGICRFFFFIRALDAIHAFVEGRALISRIFQLLEVFEMISPHRTILQKLKKAAMKVDGHRFVREIDVLLATRIGAQIE